MVLSPSREARLSNNSKVVGDWSLAPECFQENLGSPVKSKADLKDGLDSFVLQDSDLANRQLRSPVSGAKSIQEIPKSFHPTEEETGDAFRPDPAPAPAPFPAPESQPDEHASRKESEPEVGEGFPEGGQGSAESQLEDSQALRGRENAEVEEQLRLPSVDKSQDPKECSDNNSNMSGDQDLSKLVHGGREKDSSGEWSDGVSRRKERVVPEETLRRSQELEDGDDSELAPLPFSGPIISAAGYSGPMFSSGGSISRRSDGSSTSTRSFAFPILPYEWNASPARMPPPDRRWRRRSWWCKCKSCWCSCFSQPSTHP